MICARCFCSTDCIDCTLHMIALCEQNYIASGTEYAAYTETMKLCHMFGHILMLFQLFRIALPYVCIVCKSAKWVMKNDKIKIFGLRKQ